MDHDHNSPIARRFQDTRLDLNDDANLWLSFSPLTKSVDFAVYDRSVGQHGDYTLKYQTGSDAKSFVHAVESRYGVEVPVELSDAAQEFDAIASTFVTLNVDLTVDNDGDSDSTVCDSCGTYFEDTVEAFYAPSTDNLPASIAFHWEFGCFGGLTVSGEATEDLLNEIDGHLRTALDQAKSVEVASEINAFLAQLPR